MEIPYAVTIRPDTGLNNARLGLWLFLASEAMLFGGLISAYVFLRVGSSPGHFGQGSSEIPLAGMNTIVLLGSSLTMMLSLKSLRQGMLARFRLMLGTTIVLGALFVGIKWLDYAHKFSQGVYPAESTFLAIFFTLTGVHALHVIGGLFVNSHILLTAGKLWNVEPGRLSSRASAAALYWNFVDAIWLILFLLLYIV